MKNAQQQIISKWNSIQAAPVESKRTHPGHEFDSHVSILLHVLRAGNNRLCCNIWIVFRNNICFVQFVFSIYAQKWRRKH